MRIRDIPVQHVKAGRNWGIVDDRERDLCEWLVEPRVVAGERDIVVYSGLAWALNGEVWPLLLVREVGTYEWWGDTLQYVDGRWTLELVGDWTEAETFVANPLANDPSFLGEYCHDRQRAGFARWSDRIRV